MEIQSSKILGYFFKKQVWLIVLLLLIVGSAIYSFNLNNDLFWDDDDWIINNTFVHSTSWSNIKFWFTHNALAGVGLTSNYYRPFLFFTFALNYVFSGLKPLTYHLVSNAIHILNGILVFWLIRAAFKRNLLALLVSLLFLVHPLQTEAITYISGRGDALAAMFMLMGLLFFYKRETTEFKILFRLLSILSLILGLLSRETAIIFPFMAVALYVSVLSDQRFTKSLKSGLIKVWPYFVVVTIYGLLRLTVLNFQNTLNFYVEPNVYSENLFVRLLTFLPILWEYFKLLVVPIGLHMERSAIVYTSLLQWPVWPVAMIVFSILYAVFRFYRKSKVAGNGYPAVDTNYRVWLLGVLWFFIALAPVSGITPINALIYEHWLYMPMIGFWLIISFYLSKLFDDFKTKSLSVYSLMLSTALVAYLIFFSYQSIQRNILWGKQIEFYEDILKYQPKSLKINNNLGNLYLNQGDAEKAEIYYREAIATGDIFSQPYYNLGRILQTRGDISGALKLYEKAAEIDPSFYYAYQNLAVIYAQQGNLVKAAENIEKLKKILPQNPRVFYNSALVYLALKNKTQALEDLKTGLKYVQLDPETGKLIEELTKELEK